MVDQTLRSLLEMNFSFSLPLFLSVLSSYIFSTTETFLLLEEIDDSNVQTI